MRAVAALVTVLALTLALALSQHSGVRPSATVSPDQLASARGDDQSPSGCLALTGQPLPSTCEPCPPLWLGGSTIRCISASRFQDENHDLGHVSAATNVLAWLPACPAVPALSPLRAGSRVGGWLCGAGFLTDRERAAAGGLQGVDNPWASPGALRN